jgi:hypothetical protein
VNTPTIIEPYWDTMRCEAHPTMVAELATNHNIELVLSESEMKDIEDALEHCFRYKPWTGYRGSPPLQQFLIEQMKVKYNLMLDVLCVNMIKDLAYIVMNFIIVEFEDSDQTQVPKHKNMFTNTQIS